jgi:hypothetical protein
MKIALFFILTVCVKMAASDIDANKLANAIYIIEGGKATKYPYGVKSVVTRGNRAKARKICINTIRNTYKRWLEENKPNNFLDYLADRYCPPSVDRVGNLRWKVNIRKFASENT